MPCSADGKLHLEADKVSHGGWHVVPKDTAWDDLWPASAGRGPAGA